MTRKDYVALAEAFATHQPDERKDGAQAWAQWRLDVEGVAVVLAADNPRFDRQRFIAACQGKRWFNPVTLKTEEA